MFLNIVGVLVFVGLVLASFGANSWTSYKLAHHEIPWWKALLCHGIILLLICADVTFLYFRFTS